MSRRDRPERRCDRCRLPHELCLCAEIATVTTSTELLLLLHRDEERKPTNTGQLAARVLSNSRVVVTGDLQRPLPQPLLDPARRTLLLFPADHAVELQSIAPEERRAERALDVFAPRPRSGRGVGGEGDRRAIVDEGSSSSMAQGAILDDRPITLVVPDGTWRQASKARARIPGLQDVQCVTLPPGPPTTYRLRAEPKEHGLATLEAIARAFAILEGAHVEAALLDVFRKQVDRTLWMRGTLSEREVYGGISAAAHAAHLRG